MPTRGGGVRWGLRARRAAMGTPGTPTHRSASHAPGSVAVTLIVILATIGIGGPGLAGTASAQSGTVALQDPIFENENAFYVDVAVSSGLLLTVENEANDHEPYSEFVSEDTRIVVDAADVGGIAAGDDITATLYEYVIRVSDGSTTEVASDTVTVRPVSASVELEDPILVGTEQFDVEVTELEGLKFATVVVTNEDNEHGSFQESVAFPQTVTVSVPDDIGPIAAGDTITAVLYEGDGDVRLDTDATTVTRPAFFAVRIDEVNTPVLEDDLLAVDATVTNTGDHPATQSITLAINGVVRDRITLELDAGESRSVLLTWNTEPGDAGEYVAAVSSDDDTATRSITVHAPAFFTVTINETNTPVTEGRNLTVTSVITNTGDVPDTQPITLTVDGVDRDTTDVSVDGGESETVTLTWPTEAGDAGEYTAEVTSEDDANTTQVTVLKPPNFTVELTAVASPVLEGGALTVNATINNTGGVPDTQPITLTVGGVDRDATNLTLAGGDSENVTLTWRTTLGDAGAYTAEVMTENNSAATPVEVLRPANFTVDVTGTSSPVREGESLAVEATITNTGDVADTQPVTLTVDGVVRDSVQLTVDGNDVRTITLRWATSVGDAGEYTATVASEDDADAAAITVTAPGGANGGGGSDGLATFDVTIDDTTTTPEGTLEIATTIENTGDVEDTQLIILTIDGVQRGTQEVTLAGGEARSVAFTWEDPGDVDEHLIEVASDDDLASATINLGDFRGAAFGRWPLLGGSLSDTAATIGLLFLLALFLAVYYYVRRRQMLQSTDPIDGEADDPHR